MAQSTVKKLKVGVAGLGRMGQRHALHFLNIVPRAELVAVCTIVPHEIDYAKKELVPQGVRVYDSYDDLLQDSEIEAIVIATSTASHGEFIIKAIHANKHVLTEKPIADNLEEAEKIVNLVKENPHLKVTVGFSRRFDASYRNAYKRVADGLIGRPTVLYSQTGDKWPEGFIKNYGSTMGGIWLDMGIHDVDLMYWFLGEDSKLKSISSVGVCVVEPELESTGFKDNALALVEFYDGKVAQLSTSGIQAAGQEDNFAITGTKAKITVNNEPQSNFVKIHDQYGIRKEVPQNYFERFSEAFVLEANEFTSAVLDNKPVAVTVEQATRALRTVDLLNEALSTGKKLFFDRDGNRVDHL